MKPLVSILIPAFNAQEFIADTLRSAISQTWEPKEIIVVDDGSTDRTLQVARQFESEGVHVVSQRNQGAAATRNRAFSMSQGDYVQWLDADDLLAPDKITKQMEVLDRCGSKRTLASSPWGRFLHRYKQAKFVPTALWQDLPALEWLVCKMEQNLHMQTATWLVSRQLTQIAGPWNTKLLGDDDGEYFCRVLLQSDGVRFVSQANVYYRASGSNSLSYIGFSDKKRDAQWHSMRLHIGYLRSVQDTDRIRSACVKYLQDWLVFFYPERLDLVREMQQVALELGGGELEIPRLPWKYKWIDAIFGENLARRAQITLPRWKWCVLRSWDKALFSMENHILSRYATAF